MKAKAYSLIIWDEMHHIGGEETWKRVRSIRTACPRETRKSRGELNADEEEALKQVGYYFQPVRKRKRYSRKMMLELLKKLRIEKPDLRIRRDMVINDIPVGEIVHTERKRYKLGRMNPEEIIEWTAVGVIG